MGAAYSVELRIKLLNSTMDVPNDQIHKPSHAVQTVAEFPFNLFDNKTTFVPLIWSVNGAKSENGSAIIKSLKINNHPVEITVSDSAFSFKLIIELWVQNPNSGNFEFGWASKEGFSSASIYMSFNLNSSIP